MHTNFIYLFIFFWNNRQILEGQVNFGVKHTADRPPQLVCSDFSNSKWEKADSHKYAHKKRRSVWRPRCWLGIEVYGQRPSVYPWEKNFVPPRICVPQVKKARLRQPAGPWRQILNKTTSISLKGFLSEQKGQPRWRFEDLRSNEPATTEEDNHKGIILGMWDLSEEDWRKISKTTTTESEKRWLGRSNTWRNAGNSSLIHLTIMALKSEDGVKSPAEETKKRYAGYTNQLTLRVDVRADQFGSTS